MSLHPSTTGLLTAEIALLKTLQRRAKDQHRSQPFIRRIDQVLRLSRLLIPALSQSHLPSARLQSLLAKMTTALITAARVTSQIIELYHFLPLHVSLLAIYARLFAITQHVTAVLDIKDSGRESLPPVKVSAAASPVLPHFGDMGTKVARPMEIDTPPSYPVPTPPDLNAPMPLVDVMPAEELNADEAQNVNPVESRSTSPSRKNARAESSEPQPKARPDKKKKKKKRLDAMDDIFSLM